MVFTVLTCRATALSLKFMLVTMLRQAELRPARVVRDRDDGRAAATARLAGEQSARRHGACPHVERAAATGEEEEARFPATDGAGALDHRAGQAGGLRVHFQLRQDAAAEGIHGGRAARLKGSRKVHQLCGWLGIAPFSPNDLRRSAATHAHALAGCSIGDIAYCLDHQDNRGKDAAPDLVGHVA